jgi:uncharacterized protein (DUF169 family)
VIELEVITGLSFAEVSERFQSVFGDQERGRLVSPVGIKLIPEGQTVPDGTRPPDEHQGIPWCEAVRTAAIKGEVVVITKDNVGCPAAAIALGLVDQRQREPLPGKRNYTDLMSQAASPADFTEGLVYACKGSGNMQFALFGEDDTGRYATLAAARKAVASMPSVQPARMAAAVAYVAGALSMVPDVVVLALRPKQALLAIQGHNYLTGNRFEMSTVGIRGVCADLTAMPFLEQRLNGSLFCLGARALGGWEGDLLGLGMPFKVFTAMVTGMEESAGGFPYKAYPG